MHWSDRIRHCPAPLLGAILLAALAGCHDPEPVSSYSLPKRDRLLAAVVPDGQTLWLFKLAGPKELVEEKAEQFREFIKSAKFGEPTPWTIPADWTDWKETQGEDGATMIELGSSRPPLRLYVVPLLVPSLRDHDAVVLQNVNRWRGQLVLPPYGRGELLAEAETFPVGDSTATLVSFLGNLEDGATYLNPPTPPRNLIEYQKPALWRVAEKDQISLYAFAVGDEEENARITVSSFAGGGSLLANVNRWRKFVKLDEIKEEELGKLLKPMEVDGHTAYFVELVGPASAEKRETILAVIVQRERQKWFFRLRGDFKAAEQERESFRAFVDSVKFVTVKKSNKK